LKLNDRRLLELAVTERAGTPKEMFNSICASIDKLDKESWGVVSEELREKGLKQEQVDRLSEFIELTKPLKVDGGREQQK
jgi:ribosomal protein S13